MWLKKMYKRVSNAKSKAWDMLGLSFFEIGHIPTRTNKQLIEKFFENVQSNSTCCIAGASTLNLIEKSIKNGLKTTVLDFSPTMCKELSKHLGKLKNLCDIKLCDVTDIKLKPLNKYDYIFADQIINCFSNNELNNFLSNISKMLNPNGEFRTLIKVGLYEVDNRLVEKGKEYGSVPNFFEQQPLTIDYSKAIKELRAIFPKKLFSKNKLFEYYSHKGLEMRFTDDGIDNFILNNKFSGGEFKILESETIMINTEERYMFYKLRIVS